MLYVGRYLILVGLFYLIESVIGEICYKKNYYYSYYYYFIYCGNGCCGSLYSRYCCESVGVIAGACISGVVVIIIIIVIIIICKKKKQATVVTTISQPSTHVTTVSHTQYVPPPQPMVYGYVQPAAYPGQPMAYGAQPATNPAYPPPSAKY